MHTHPPAAVAGQQAAKWAERYAVLWFVAALALVGFASPLTSVLLLLSTFLFVVVTRYSRRYMSGDRGQPRFMFWLCVTSTFVFVLVTASNLLVFVIAWCGISLSLHRLLQFYGERPAAVLAARKKFLISRLGDAALLTALVLTRNEFGAWDFKTIFAAAERLRLTGPENLPVSVSVICWLLVFGALLKSAQFPFHSWLPDTMETPTPVSALMHAGIINAGGILILRLSPLVVLSQGSMLALCLIGGFTAIFASTVMLTQASIKRCLAFSTVAQMGFMMLECGLGAFHLALLHLVAHSLYKAHGFLSSGSVVAANTPAEPRRLSLPALATSIAAAAALSYSTAAAAGVSPLDGIVLYSVFVIALAQMLWALSSALSWPWQVPAGIIFGVTLSIVYFGLEIAAAIVAPPIPVATGSVGIVVAGVFLLAAAAQSQLPRLAVSSAGRKLYVHARNGFYVNTVANRITASVWPTRVSQEGI